MTQQEVQAQAGKVLTQVAGYVGVRTIQIGATPPKIYISGYRIHHGLIGTLLGLAGLITEKPAITGLGVKLALDDIADMPEWFNFERNNSNQYNNNIPLDYNGFA